MFIRTKDRIINLEDVSHIAKVTHHPVKRYEISVYYLKGGSFDGNISFDSEKEMSDAFEMISRQVDKYNEVRYAIKEIE